MKLFVVLAVIAAVAAAAPAGAGPDALAETVRSAADVLPDGFSYLYETSNGIKGEEQGQLTNPGSENEAIEVRGQYSYIGPDGVTYAVTYTAGANGFQPQGAHLPQVA